VALSAPLKVDQALGLSIHLKQNVKELADIYETHPSLSKAFLAASTAMLTSSALPAATWQITFSVAGLITGIFSLVPFTGSTHWPLMKS
jgi:hypothetical protein